MSLFMIRGFGLALALCTSQISAQAAERFISFPEFIQGGRLATSSQYVGRAPAKVGNAAAFTEMRQHVLRMYDGVHVHHSYVLDSEYFDCVPIMEQPSVRLLGLKKVNTAPPQAARSVQGEPGSATDAEPAMQTGLVVKVDQFGNSIPCESGTIPMRRITLEELTKFSNLREFFQKEPGKAGQSPFKEGYGRAAASHKYAHAYQNIANHGGASYLNLWNPN